MTHHEAKKENGLAVASLVLGILAITGASILTGIPAIITGAMSLKNPVNKGMGVAGLVMGVVSVVLFLLIVAFFIFLIGLGVFSEPYQTYPADPPVAPIAPAASEQQI